MSYPKKTRHPVVLAAATLALFGSMAAHAQWSLDPAANLIVSDISGGNTQPKMVPTPDGGFYVSWFDNYGSGFDIHLQRLDANGNEMWAHNGVLVADRSFSYTYDYGLAVDTAGNAYLSYNCCENSTPDEHISVSKVGPDGTLLWGSDGIDVSTAAEGVYNTYVSVTDGDVVVAWSTDTGLRAQKLDASGNAQWATDGVLINQPAGLKLLGGVQVGTDDNVIVSWTNQPNFYTRELTAQKLAGADGAPQWNGGTGIRVFGEGTVQPGYYPPFIADGAGGGVFWDYDFVGTSKFVARAQHLDANGSPLLGINGVLGTTDASQDHVSTSAAFDPASGDIYLVWSDSYVADQQDYAGVSAQRIDADGNRAWGDTGKVLVVPAISTDSTYAISQLVALPAPGGFIASWVTGAIPAVNQPITATRLDSAGDYVWSMQNVDVKTSGYTGRTGGAVSTNGVAAYTWQDGDDLAGVSTIRAQNLNLDGSLGPVTTDVIFKDGFDGP